MQQQVQVDTWAVIYVNGPRPNPADQEIIELCKDRLDMSLQDATKIPPSQRPRWLVGTPTVVIMNDQRRVILSGSQALRTIRSRMRELQLWGGIQDENIIGIDPSTSVVPGEHHLSASQSEAPSIPMGQVSSALDGGAFVSVDGRRDDMSRYTNDNSITQSDIQRYLQERDEAGRPPTQRRPDELPPPLYISETDGQGNTM